MLEEPNKLICKHTLNGMYGKTLNNVHNRGSILSEIGTYLTIT